MGAVDSTAEPRRTNRIYHSHSRSRQLLSLPVSPSISHDFQATDFMHARRPKSLTLFRLCFPSVRMAASAAVATSFILLLTFVAVPHFAPPAVFSGSVTPRFVPSEPANLWSASRTLSNVSVTDMLVEYVQRTENQSTTTASTDSFAQTQSTSEDADAHINRAVADASVTSPNDAPTDDVTIEGVAAQSVSQKMDNDTTLTQADESTSSVAGVGIRVVEPISVDESSRTTEIVEQPESKPSPKDELGTTVLDSSAKQAVGFEHSPAMVPSSVSDHDPADFSTFTENTALNYFHLHKTGGVSFKERLFDFFLLEEKINSRGEKAYVVDTCHMKGPARPALGREARWSCDWTQMSSLSEDRRNKIDVIVGHQYWEQGAGYWLPRRDLRFFTVMRHPLHRKISFFYHFFVRNAGRTEESVKKEELIDFVLGRKMPASPLARDAGPAYYASRLWSDGIRGFNDSNQFIISDEDAKSFVSKSIRRLRKNFVFIGLQMQENASLCMLKKTIAAFARAHGFNTLSGLEGIVRSRQRMNTGSYELSGEVLWDTMNEQEKEEFKRVERVDLEIYKESVKMFHERVTRFGCADLVSPSNGDLIAL